MLAHDDVCPNLSVCGGSESWNVTSQSYLVTSMVSVCEGSTLDIDAGVESRGVRFSGLRVAGTLNVLGTPSQPVLLTTDDPTPVRGDWDGLEFVAGGAGQLEHAEIAWPTRGVEATDADIVLRDSTIDGAQQYGLWQKGGTLAIEGSRMSNHGSYGMFLSDQASFAVDTVEVTTSSAGIYVDGGSVGTVLDFDASGNTYGIYAYRSSAGPTTVDIARSRLRGNLYGLWVQGQTSASFFQPEVTVTTSELDGNTNHAVYTSAFFDAANSFVYAPDNWWGSDDPEVIDATIFDHTDNANSPRVMTRPFGFNCDPAVGRDADRDGVSDFTDNCPNDANAAQIDSDGDAMGDACDAAPASEPTAACNGIDDVTDGWIDSDGDGWGDPCDFHPLRDDTYPGAPEICDGRDNDGDHVFAEGELVDLDLDGAVDCLDGMGDCDDMNAAIFPCNCERCDNVIDDDCSGAADVLDPTCPLNDYCVIITPGSDPLELTVDRGACGGANGAAATDLIQGSTANLGLSGGSIDLGDISCVQQGLLFDRVDDTALDGNPACNPGSVFWLARPAGNGDFGSSSDGSPRDVSNPNPICQ